MADPRFVVAQFCDDIRHELGNKISLIGCYGAELIVPNLPAVLPKLCAQVKVFVPADQPLGPMTVRLRRDEEILGELLAIPPTSPQAETDDARWHLVTALITLAPFSIEGPCALRAEAALEDGEILRSGVLRIRALAETPPTEALPSAH